MTTRAREAYGAGADVPVDLVTDQHVAAAWHEPSVLAVHTEDLALSVAVTSARPRRR